MFTGIIEELGIIEKIDRPDGPAVFTIKAGKILAGLKKGDSVSVNGACLTVVAVGKKGFSVEAIRETLAKTNLEGSKAGDRVNLEGPLVSGGKVNGHFVTGHVDGTGTVISRKDEKGEILFEVGATGDIIDGMIMKGSVAVDGVSLTVSGVKSGSFSFYVIPHTAKETTLGAKKAGEKVNLETDMLGKYIARYSGRQKPSNITEKLLKDNGFI